MALCSSALANAMIDDVNLAHALLHAWIFQHFVQGTQKTSASILQYSIDRGDVGVQTQDIYKGLVIYGPEL